MKEKINKVLIVIFCALVLFVFKNENAYASVDFNCYCLNGSAIPAYYPKVKALNTSDFDSCNQECANIGAKYFSFSTVSHVGATLVSKKPQTNDNVVSPSVNGSVGPEMDNKIPGTPGPASQLVTCGRAGQDMCTLCDLIAGLNNVIRFIEHLAVGVGVLAFTIGGVMYVISAGDSGMKTKANTTMKNAIIGFVIIFAAWIIVNTVITYMGTYSDLGIHVTSWGNFNCNANLGGK